MAKTGCFWHADKKTCLDLIWKDYEENDKYPQMLRHFYYVLLSNEALRIYPKTGLAKPEDQAYKWVSSFLVEARENGDFPWHGIIDSGRRSFTRSRGRGLQSFSDGCQRAYYILDPWRFQRWQLEVWVEKDDMADVLNRMVSGLRIPIYVAKGYGSATVKNDACNRYGDGSRHVLLYCGDFDPTGVDIERELKDKLAENGAYPIIERVTLTYEHTLQLPLTTAVDLKEGDPRTKRFKEMYPGSKGYELNIAGTRNIEERLLAAVGRYMDKQMYDAAIDLEDRIEEEATKRLQNVMDGFVEEVKKRGAPGSALPLETQLRYFAAANEDEMSG